MNTTSGHVATADGSHLFTACQMDACELVPAALGEVAVFSRRSPDKESSNEDSALVLVLPGARCLLAVADGVGGLPVGHEASRLCLERFRDVVAASTAAGATLRDAVLDGYEAANRHVLATTNGAGTTLTVVEIDGRAMRSYHVGDSVALVAGQRGRIKHATTAHSPVGYGVESGLLTEDEAFVHEDRHVISNMVGATDMRIEIGPRIRLGAFDRVLLASDGLFDNLRVDEIVDGVRRGPLARSVDALATLAHRRMAGGDAKPDDLTVVAYRQTRERLLATDADDEDAAR